MLEEEKKEQDNQIDAQASEKSQLVDAGLVKPLPHSEEPLAYIPAPPRVIIDGKPRQKTFGEKLFDVSVYGGIGWIANEILSGVIHDRTVYKGEPFYNAYKAGVNGLHKLFGVAVDHPEKWLTKVKRPFDILIMTIGGNLLVLPMKIAEDHKGTLVRIADNARGKTDPETQKAHAEMDAAPKQSWGSLAQSRLVTMAGAIGIDYAFGADNAWSTKMFGDVGKKKWASLNNINVSIFRNLAKFAAEKFNFQPEVIDNIKVAEEASPFTILTKNHLEHLPDTHELKNFKPEGTIARLGNSYGFIFLLSGVLAGTFYITSRIFAFNREQKKAERIEHPNSGGLHFENAEAISADTPQLEAAPQDEKPKTKVTHAQHPERLSHAHQEAVNI